MTTDRPLRIGIVCYPTYGGSGVLATELGLGLAKRGHSIHFISYRQPARLRGFQENVFYHEVNPPDYPLFEYIPYETSLTSRLVEVVRYEKLDLVHVHYAIPHAAVGYMAKKILLSQGRYVPFVTTLHGTDITLVGNDPSFMPVVEFSINRSDGVTAVSNALRQLTLDAFAIDTHIEVIHNFIDLDRFQRSNKQHFRQAIAPNSEKILIHISNFRKVKRVQDVIYTFGKVREKVESKLLLVGDGPERRSMEALCRELKLCDDIIFLGKQDQIEEILSIADLMLMPSESESFGLAALEAMACQVPVVSTDVGGLPEVNIDGETGYLTKVGDIETMGEKALYILEDEERLAQFRAAAYAQAQRFDIRRIAPLYETFYHQVIEQAVVQSTVQ